MVAQPSTLPHEIRHDAHAIRIALVASLIDRGKLTQAGLERAVRLAAESSERLELVLTRLGIVSERDVAETLSLLLDLPLAELGQYPGAPVLEERFSRKFLKEAQMIPFADGPDVLSVAMVDPLNTYGAEAARFAAGKPITRLIAYPSDFEVVFDRLYGDGKSGIHQIADETRQHEPDSADNDVERIKDSASEAPVIRLVNLLITRAVEARASDIHIEPMESELRVRYRIDGMLIEMESPAHRLSAAIVSRVKIMAKLNIAERRIAQDGRIRLAVRGKDIDFRVSTMPTIHGESVVLRILDRGNLKLDFGALGFDDDIAHNIRDVLDRPHGILLVTGPTGSGKTTTLYTGLLELNTPDKKILTVEDPVEYELAGINQVQVKPQIGLTFASALRSFLRQDPDIMMVGEIRDLETAQIAVQAALTGHLILATLHTNDAASAITRLIDMGVENFLLTSTINGLVAQRLVRILCPHCRVPYDAPPDLVERIGLTRDKPAPLLLYRAKGCDACGDTGYMGRTSIVEVLVMSAAIRALVLNNAEAAAIRRVAMGEGMQTMQMHGIKKAIAGQTSIEEVLRATRMI